MNRQNMKSLKLSHALAQKIQNGQVRSTWRLFDEKNLSVNDVVAAIDKVNPDDPSSWQPIGELHITEVVEKRLGDIGPKDYDPGEHPEPLKKLLKRFRGYYHGQHITKDMPVKLLKFEFRPLSNSFLSGDAVSGLEKPVDKKSTDKFVLYTDGGSRGNPGPSACGYVLLRGETVIESDGKYLGVTTNNQAEYQALKLGLERALVHGAQDIVVRMDSMLVVNQMKGIFKVKNRDLWPIHDSIKSFTTRFRSVTFTHVPRELNKLADREVNKALDVHLAGLTAIAHAK